MKKERNDKNDACAFLNGLVTAQKLLRKRFESLEAKRIYVVHPGNTIMISNLAEWCNLLDQEYGRVDWDGNEQCDTNWDKIFFNYKGFEFYELVDKIVQ